MDLVDEAADHRIVIGEPGRRRRKAVAVAFGEPALAAHARGGYRIRSRPCVASLPRLRGLFCQPLHFHDQLSDLAVKAGALAPGGLLVLLPRTSRLKTVAPPSGNSFSPLPRHHGGQVVPGGNPVDRSRSASPIQGNPGLEPCGESPSFCLLQGSRSESAVNAPAPIPQIQPCLWLRPPGPALATGSGGQRGIPSPSGDRSVSASGDSISIPAVGPRIAPLPVHRPFLRPDRAAFGWLRRGEPRHPRNDRRWRDCSNTRCHPLRRGGCVHTT
jgi:hypothetical protein